MNGLSDLNGSMIASLYTIDGRLHEYGNHSQDLVLLFLRSTLDMISVSCSLCGHLPVSLSLFMPPKPPSPWLFYLLHRGYDLTSLGADMSESKIALILGDPYRCEQALEVRHAAILTEFPDTEKAVLFGDELHLPNLQTTLLSTSLFVLGRHFVIHHAEMIQAAKPFARLLKERLPQATFLTLLAEQLTPANPILNLMKKDGNLKAFPPLKGKAVEKAAAEIFAEHNVQVTPAAVKELISRTGNNLFFIAQEAKKLRAFAPEAPLDEDAIARLGFASGERSIYPLLDRVGERNLRSALATLSWLHEDPGKIFSMLLYHLTRVLMARVLLDEGTPSTKATKLLALPGWLVTRLFSQAKHYSAKDLHAFVDHGIALDLAIKRGGIRPEDALVKLILAATTPASPAPECTRRSRPARAAAG